jgi:hypothetical protein
MKPEKQIVSTNAALLNAVEDARAPMIALTQELIAIRTLTPQRMDKSMLFHCVGCSCCVALS